jgi:hypothetical protein
VAVTNRPRTNAERTDFTLVSDLVLGGGELQVVLAREALRFFVEELL